MEAIRQKEISNYDLPHSEHGRRVSEAEYWEKYYEYVGPSDFRYEWNNGVLEDISMADYHSSLMYEWFVSLLKEYLKTNPIAKLVFLDIGFRLEIPDKVSIRKPDIGILVNTNPVDIALEDRTFHGIYDMCIEFLSDSTSDGVNRDTVEKKYEYAKAGVIEYFILDRNGEETAFFRVNKQGYYSKIKQLPGGVIRSEVLPGFQFRINDLYTRPSLMDRISDNIYRHYILTEYQEAIEMAEAEREKAEAEKIRAECEKKRAETERIRAESEKNRAESEKNRAESEKKRAETERIRAESEKSRAESEKIRAESEKSRADQAEKIADKLAKKLRDLGVNPDDVK